jgi:hypothetical protein
LVDQAPTAPNVTVAETKYAVIATTKGIFDYAVNVRVDAYCIGNSCSVNYAEVASGSGYKRVSLIGPFNGEYSFSWEGHTYYFSF